MSTATWQSRIFREAASRAGRLVTVWAVNSSSRARSSVAIRSLDNCASRHPGGASDLCHADERLRGGDLVGRHHLPGPEDRQLDVLVDLAGQCPRSGEPPCVRRITGALHRPDRLGCHRHRQARVPGGLRRGRRLARQAEDAAETGHSKYLADLLKTSDRRSPPRTSPAARAPATQPTSSCSARRRGGWGRPCPPA